MSENGEFNENNSTDTVNDAELKAYVEELKTARMRNLYIGSIFIVLAIILIACLVFFFNIETIQIEGVTLNGSVDKRFKPLRTRTDIAGGRSCPGSEPYKARYRCGRGKA